VSEFDLVVVGAGAAGLSCALFGARAGARVLLVDKAAEMGGTLHVCEGRISAAGAKRQKEAGVEDSAEAHFADLKRAGGDGLRDDLVRLALPQGAWLVDWLEEQGVRFAVGEEGIAPAKPSRIVRPEDGGRAILRVLTGLLEPLVQSGAVTLSLNTRVKALLTDKRRVVGIQAARGGSVQRHFAVRGVVLATGGFAASAELFKEVEGLPLFSAAPGRRARQWTRGRWPPGLIVLRGAGR